MITVFYKLCTYFQNFVTVLEVKVLNTRNWLTFIHNLYKLTNCSSCKVVTIPALDIIIEILVLYFTLLAVLRSYSYALSVSTAGFVNFEENSYEGIYGNNAIIEYRNAL